MKAKLFSTQSILVSLKAIGVSIVTSLILIIPILIARYIQNVLTMPLIAVLVGLLTLVGYLFVWGYLASRFWNWK